ncbi:MAG: S8 family serine peptidase, partial [Solirubrobacterales bacterium]|nr:S8 family serine peptidase [Solirubrobacterales bacterium]
TAHGCLWTFTSHGPGLDLVAPGGGSDAPFPGDARCDPDDDTLPDITQITLRNDGGFGPSRGYRGSSMAAAHVSAAAALVIASRTLGRTPSPAAVERRLERTARDLGAPGPDTRYGHGLLDAAAATAP